MLSQEGTPWQEQRRHNFRASMSSKFVGSMMSKNENWLEKCWGIYFLVKYEKERERNIHANFTEILFNLRFEPLIFYFIKL